MTFKNICKDTGYFFVGASVWAAQNTAKAAVITGKATAKATKKMVEKGEAIVLERKAASEQRKREQLLAAMRAEQEKAEATEVEVFPHSSLCYGGDHIWFRQR